MIKADIQAMTDGYIECALFTADEELITPMSGEFDVTPHLSRIPASMKAEALRVCTEFFDANAEDLEQSWYPANCAGHDLWYTRNHHGCGFWEEDYCNAEQGERLTAAAHKLGERSIYRSRGGWFGFDG